MTVLRAWTWPLSVLLLAACSAPPREPHQTGHMDPGLAALSAQYHGRPAPPRTALQRLLQVDGPRRASPANDVYRQRRRINVAVVEAELPLVLERIAAVVGVPIQVEAGQQAIVDLEREDVPWLEAVGALAAQAWCQVELRDGAVHVVDEWLTIPDAGGRPVLWVLERLAAQRGKRLAAHPSLLGDDAVTIPPQEVLVDFPLASLVAVLDGAYGVSLAETDLFLFAGPRQWVAAKLRAAEQRADDD